MAMRSEFLSWLRRRRERARQIEADADGLVRVLGAEVLLDWSQTKLAEHANLSESTIRDFEKGRRIPSINNLSAVQRALEAAFVEFIAENGGGPGVRMRKGD